VSDGEREDETTGEEKDESAALMERLMSNLTNEEENDADEELTMFAQMRDN